MKGQGYLQYNSSSRPGCAREQLVTTTRPPPALVGGVSAQMVEQAVLKRKAQWAMEMAGASLKKGGGSI